MKLTDETRSGMFYLPQKQKKNDNDPQGSSQNVLLNRAYLNDFP